MNKNRLILRLSIILVTILLLLWAVPAKGQYFIEDPTLLPVAPTRTCDCDPLNIETLEVQQALLEIVMLNWNTCIIFGQNQWGHESNSHNCGKGQGHIFNEYGEFATYLYNEFNPDNPYEFKAGILYFKINNPFDIKE